MFGRKTVAMLVVALLVGGVALTSVQAASIDLGTAGHAGNWNVTVYGDSGIIAADQPSYQTSSWISITSTTYSGGTWVAGADNTAFNGLWTATSIFNVPADAENISFTFSNLLGDDRVALELNGHRIGLATVDSGGAGAGILTYPVTGNESVTYGTTSGDASAYVLIGANTLRLIVNNTNAITNLSAADRNLNGSEDATGAGFAATLTYTPEPATMSLLALGGLAMLRRRSTK
ncbi:MAG: PEP-CTERM sorting domain-containing protein [Planctomycetaceae bacterium]|nr:MAG: PEP-CTERM sorting domain-containing protein [Planctomycetaceae bacterium]